MEADLTLRSFPLDWLPRPAQSSVDFALRACHEAETIDSAPSDFRSVVEMRRVLGIPLPFARLDSNGAPSDYYVPNSFVHSRATKCMGPAMGSYYMRASMVQPEGRHLCLARVLQEVLGCASYLGWSVSRERAFALLTGVRKPASEPEHLMQRLGAMLISPPSGEMSSHSLMTAYEQLLEGLAIGESSRLDERIDPVQRDRFLEAMCAFLYDQGETAEHPVVKVVLFKEAIRSIKPFPTANLLMARIAFSWAANELGIPAAGYVPVVDFLEKWRKGHDIESSYNPRIPFNRAVVEQGAFGAEWTPWLEEVLGFIGDDLDYFETKLILLLMKRERVEYLAGFEPSLNERQRGILIEAMLHEDAEFTYASIMEEFGVAYATAYSDLGKLEARGYLEAVSLGKATVFIASAKCREIFHKSIRCAAPEEYGNYYNPMGGLSDTYVAEREVILERCKKSASIKGDYLNVRTPSLIPERCFVILSDGGRRRRVES